MPRLNHSLLSVESTTNWQGLWKEGYIIRPQIQWSIIVFPTNTTEVRGMPKFQTQTYVNNWFSHGQLQGFKTGVAETQVQRAKLGKEEESRRINQNTAFTLPGGYHVPISWTLKSGRDCWFQLNRICVRMDVWDKDIIIVDHGWIDYRWNTQITSYRILQILKPNQLTPCHLLFGCTISQWKKSVATHLIWGTDRWWNLAPAARRNRNTWCWIYKQLNDLRFHKPPSV